MGGLDPQLSHTIHCQSNFPHTIPQFKRHFIHLHNHTFPTLHLIPPVHLIHGVNIRRSPANQYSPCLAIRSVLHALI
jgi:hypothetical protein